MSSAEDTAAGARGQEIRYSPDPTLDDYYGTHKTVARLVGRDKYVLDIGCGAGFIARRMKRNGCRVTGIEIDPELASHAESVCDSVLRLDLDNLDPTMIPGTFDAITCADVLEHLRNPAALIAKLKPLLNPDGYFVISLPNVAHVSVRTRLTLGKFNYQPFGLLDETHLRFFTLATARAFLRDAGLSEQALYINPALPRVLGKMGIRTPRALEHAIAEKLPGLFGYQFIFKATARRDSLD